MAAIGMGCYSPVELLVYTLATELLLPGRFVTRGRPMAPCVIVSFVVRDAAVPPSASATYYLPAEISAVLMTAYLGR
jgi:hypothetical protein